MGNKILKNVVHFRYLGSWISHGSQQLGETEIQYRINSAENAFYEYKKLFTNRSIALKTRNIFLDSLVKRRLCYGSHAWCLSTKL